MKADTLAGVLIGVIAGYPHRAAQCGDRWVLHALIVLGKRS